MELRTSWRAATERLRGRLLSEIASIEPEIDVAYRARCAEVVEHAARYFDVEVRGLNLLPPKGPYMLVGNHSGGAYAPDAPLFVLAFCRHWGLDAPIRPLAHNLLFSLPRVRETLRRVGALPASPDNAAQALARGEILLVYPGGDYESQRPFFESRRVDFGGRKGFIRMALRHRVPVIPVVCQGANETVLTVSRGEWLAKATGLAHVTRTKVFPLRLSFPFGVLPAFVPLVPLPAKITMEVGAPMAWQAFGPEDADNPELVDALYDDIVSTMQRTLHGLYRERPNPFARRRERCLVPRHSEPPRVPERALRLKARPIAPQVDLAEYRERHARVEVRSPMLRSSR
jgi:1-acyl-sn-glycerol-3-phosphate acyltransferase